MYTKIRSRLGLTLGEMIVFIKGNSKAAAVQDEEVVLRGLFEMQPAQMGAADAEHAAAEDAEEVIDLA